MKLHLERIYTCPSYTIGHLYQVFDNGEKKLICDTIEDTDRRLDDDMSEKKTLKILKYILRQLFRREFMIFL